MPLTNELASVAALARQMLGEIEPGKLTATVSAAGLKLVLDTLIATAGQVNQAQAPKGHTAAAAGAAFVREQMTHVQGAIERDAKANQQPGYPGKGGPPGGGFGALSFIADSDRKAT